MICQVFPRVEGIALDRFRALGKAGDAVPARGEIG
jgi:hypothetical protein